MKSFVFIAATMAATLFFAECSAQKIQNAQTVTVKVYGNCGMCEKTIEKAASLMGVAEADWDRDTKMAKLTFDQSKTTVGEILRRIAAAGYDSDDYRSTDEAYANLHTCCQYDRPAKQE